MSCRDYEYDYHDLVEGADYIEEAEDTAEEYYYNDGNDEPWIGPDEEDSEVIDNTGWENYYHTLADEIED